jgi:hypothetical protein
MNAPSPGHERASSGHERASSPDELKKISLKKIPEKKEDCSHLTPPNVVTKGSTKVDTHLHDAQRILWHLNTVNGRRYENMRYIQQTLRRGVSVDDCLLVIDFGYAVLRHERPEWYKQYFDNVTPWREENFDKYRARALEWRDEGSIAQETPNNGLYM